MKTRIIDILNKMADGTLEDGFQFKYDSGIWKYEKEYVADIYNKENRCLGFTYNLANHLTDEVEVIEDIKEIEELPIYDKSFATYGNNDIETNRYKINELVRAVNELKKEAE